MTAERTHYDGDGCPEHPSRVPADVLSQWERARADARSARREVVRLRAELKRARVLMQAADDHYAAAFAAALDLVR